MSLGRSERPVGGTSDFLGDHPPDPRFLASLGAVVSRSNLLTGPSDRDVQSRPRGHFARTFVRFAYNESGQVRTTCGWDIGLPGGSSPRPPFSRFARRAVVGRPDLLTGPSDRDVQSRSRGHFARTFVRFAYNESGQVRTTCWWDIGLPGGSSPRPPFSRFARRAVVGRADLLTGPSELDVRSRQ
jgi:hypothetical protein